MEDKVKRWSFAVAYTDKAGKAVEVSGLRHARYTEVNDTVDRIVQDAIKQGAKTTPERNIWCSTA